MIWVYRAQTLCGSGTVFLVSFYPARASIIGVEPDFARKLLGANGFEPPTSRSRT